MFVFLNSISEPLCNYTTKCVVTNSNLELKSVVLFFLVHMKLSRAVNMSGVEQSSHLFPYRLLSLHLSLPSGLFVQAHWS